MSKLKTLKDTPFTTGSLCYEYVLELREAAKEWVQALKDSLAEGLVEEHIMKRDAKIEWITWFFNLEDEDE